MLERDLARVGLIGRWAGLGPKSSPPPPCLYILYFHNIILAPFPSPPTTFAAVYPLHKRQLKSILEALSSLSPNGQIKSYIFQDVTPIHLYLSLTQIPPQNAKQDLERR